MSRDACTDTHRILENTCKSIFGFERLGGTFITRDDSTFIIADVLNICCSQLQQLQVRFPHTTIQIISSEASSSGFVIVLTVPAKRCPLLYKTYIFSAIHSIAVCFFYLYFWSKHITFQNQIHSHLSQDVPVKF